MWKTLIDFITSEVRTKETLDLEKKEVKVTPKEKEDRDKPSSGIALVSSIPRKDVPLDIKCVLCSKGHELENCPSFLKLNPNERFRTIVEKLKGICRNCLKHKGENGHPYRYCSEKCPEIGCDQFHHKLLHEGGINSLVTMLSSTSITSHLHCETGIEVDSILPTALAQLNYKGRSIKARVALDSLSQKSFITAELANLLEMDSIKNEFIVVHGFGGKQSFEKCGVVKFSLSAYSEVMPNNGSTLSAKIDIEANIKTGVICSTFDSVELDLDQCSYLNDLPLADPIPRGEGKIDVLLGSRYYYSIMQGKLVHPPDPQKMPYATGTMFGFVLGGAFQNKRIKRQTGCMVTSVKTYQSLDEKLERFWCQDILGISNEKDAHTWEERQAIDSFNCTVQYNGERYTVGLPF